jgi:hypothetical protein
MHKLVSEYRGGYWLFYELSNGGFYMAPRRDSPTVEVRVEGNQYSGQMSVDAAAITACLFAFSHLSLAFKNDVLARHYYQLRDFALDHVEAKSILEAID